MGHRQVTGADRKGDVVFRLGEPFQEHDAGGNFGLSPLRDGHPSPLLDGDCTGCVGKLRRGQDFQGDVVVLGVAGHDLRRKEGGTGIGADVAKDVAGLDVVAAETAGGGEPAPDKGHIIVIPERAGDFLREVEGHPAVLDLKEGAAQLLCAEEHIIGQCIPAEQSFALAGLLLRPLVVFFGCGDEALHGGKILVGAAGGSGKELPVGVVEEEKLGGFGGRKDLDAAAAVKVTLGKIILDVGGAFFVGEEAAQVSQQPHLVDGVGGVGIGGENARQGRRAHLALGGFQHRVLQLGDAAQTGSFDEDAFFLPEGVVELLHQLIEGLQLVAVVIGPDREGDRVAGRQHGRRGRSAACTAADAAQRQSGQSQQL